MNFIDIQMLCFESLYYNEGLFVKLYLKAIFNKIRRRKKSQESTVNVAVIEKGACIGKNAYAYPGSYIKKVCVLVTILM